MSSTAAARASAKLEKVRVERDRLFSAGRYYEALQLYKTMCSRLAGSGAVDAAVQLSAEGAEQLLQHQQVNSGLEMAINVITLYTKYNVKCDETSSARVLALLRCFPDDITSTHLARSNLLKAAIKWSSSEAGGHGPWGLPDFHLALARTHRSFGDYGAAHLEYIRAGKSTYLSAYSLLTFNDRAIQCDELDSRVRARYQEAGGAGSEYKEHAELMVEWAKQGESHEQDLFITRAVLQYLCLNNTDGAASFLTHVLRLSNSSSTPSTSPVAQPKSLKDFDQAASDSPLIHLSQFLVLLCPLGTTVAPVFDVLRYKYAPALSKDPTFTQYVERIGSVYFGQAAAKGLFDSLFSSMGAD